MLVLAAMVGVHFAVPTAKPASDGIFLRAIREVETGDDPTFRGRLGELGAYQFTYATWRRHTHLPFREARTHAADQVAGRHLLYLRQVLGAHGVALTTWTLAIAWNAGPGALLTPHHVPRSARDYADRVMALVAALQKDVPP